MREATDGIAALSEGAAKFEFLKPPAEPEHVYYIRNGQKLERAEADPKPRDHQAHDLATLGRICREFAGGEEIGDQQRVAVWYSRYGVTAFLDDEQRRDRVRLVLAASQQIRMLEKWEGAISWLDQAALIRTLRIHFPGLQGLIEALRRLKFRVNQGGEKVIEHGKTSIGNSLDAELAGTGSLPEDVMVHFPAFAGNNLAIWSSVSCLVEIDAKAEKVAIVPEAGSVEKAWLNVEDSLGRKLDELFTDSGVLVYRGVP
jgi:hypothetical protein